MKKNLILQLMVVTLFGIGQTIPLDESQYFVKDVKYDYDLVSGKVNQVTYQEGETDQLKHRYEYDGDNRITAVYTSTDGINWTKEANYEYYAHGPLAKAEIGEQKVEMQNYAYTLQGWVKGVKGQNFSYALGYNGNDYKAVGSDVTGGVLSTPVATGTDLYNGNIATWHTNNPKMADKNLANVTNQYTYDQLNRLKATRTGVQGVAFASKAYSTKYDYDANGNLLSLQRYNGTGQKFDAFKYNYEDKKSGYLANSNKLRSVDDTIADQALFAEDLEDQNIDNYQYDDIGNLSKDDQEDIEKIEWTVYGKVKAVYRKSGSLKPNLVFEYDAMGNRVSKISIANGGTVNKTFYIRDASGNVMGTYTTTGTSSLIALQEQYLYGSSRLGVLEKGTRSYELTDHLGNVRAVVDEFKEVKAAYEYFAFGMGLAKIDNGYRYGFNGQEKVLELGSDHTTAMYWEYNGKTGRRDNIDPVLDESESSYATNKGNPIKQNDPKGDCPTCDKAIQGKITIGATFGKTNRNISIGFNVAYAVGKVKSFSSEYTLGANMTLFSRVNDFKTKGSGFTFTGSAMFGKGGNTDLGGSGIVSPMSMSNSSGTSGFNGGGLGFTAIMFRGDHKVDKLSNFNYNLLGRFSVGNGSLSLNLMEDYPMTDHGSTGSFFATYTKVLAKDQAFSIGLAHETFTDKAIKDAGGKSERIRSTSDPSKNILAGHPYYTNYATGAPSYGTNALTFGYSNPMVNSLLKTGLYGGKQGAADQNFIHTKLVPTATFNHNTTYFGKPFAEIQFNGSINNAIWKLWNN